MTEQQKNPNEERNVFYWEYVFNICFNQVEEMLDSKHEYLKSLKYELYHEMNDDEELVDQIMILEEDMSKMITLIDTTENLKKAYMSSAADTASSLFQLQRENNMLKNHINELEDRVEMYSDFSKTLTEKLLLCWKGGCHE